MILKKWDFKKKKYLPFEALDSSVLMAGLKDPVACTNCRNPKIFGDCYTSLTIHSEMGFGYPVCESCYEIESTESRK